MDDLVVNSDRTVEQALSDSEQFTHDLFEASPDCLKLLDLDGRLLKMNAFGLCLMEIDDFVPFEGMDWAGIWPGEGEQQARSAVRKAAAGQSAGFSGPCPTAKGTPKHWDVQLFPVFNADGTVVRLISVSRDVTERQEATEALRVANETLEARVAERTAELEDLNAALSRSNRDLRAFAHIASHDLQEPLRKITSYADLLHTDHREALPDEAQHFVDRMQAAAMRMSRLVRDLISFSNLSTAPPAPEAVDLNETMARVQEDLDMLVRETGGSLVVGALPTLRAHPHQMRQLLQNLVGNGLKFHRPGVPPVVNVRAEPTPSGGFDLVVEDNGIGFDMQYAERIFAPFQRLHGKDAFEGTGIGLSIVRTIAEQHGATVRAEGTPGHGSRFIVSFPPSV